MTNILRTNQGSAFAYPGKDKRGVRIVRGRQAFIESLGIVYSIDRDFTGADPKAIKVYDYMNYEGDPVAVHPVNNNDFDLLERLWVTADNKYICTGRNDSLGFVFVLDSEFNLIAETSYQLFSAASNALDLAVDEKNSWIYVQQSIGSNEGYVRKFDYELNQIWEVNYDVVNHTFEGITLSRKGRLFGYGHRIFENFNGHIFEINIGTGARENPTDTPVDSKFTRPRALVESADKKLHLLCAGAENDAGTNGAILVYDYDLNHEEIIYADDFNANLNFGTGSSIVLYDCFLDGIAYECNSTDQKLKKLNYITRELVWEIEVRKMSTGGFWGNGRPNSMSVDTFGNVVVGIGIGSDSRSIGVVTEYGDPIFGEGLGLETAFSSIHYDGWQSLPNARKSKDVIPPLTPENVAVEIGDEEVVLDWDDNTEGDLAGYNVYVDGVKGNDDLIINSEYTVTNLINATEYNFQVSAVDDLGNESLKTVAIKAAPSAVTLTGNFHVGTAAESFLDGYNAEWAGVAPTVNFQTSTLSNTNSRVCYNRHNEICIGKGEDGGGNADVGELELYNEAGVLLHAADINQTIRAISADIDGEFYVLADDGIDTIIYKLDRTLTLVTSLTINGTTDYRSLVIDKDKNLYAGGVDLPVKKYDSDFTLLWTSPQNYHVILEHSVAATKGGRLFVADYITDASRYLFELDPADGSQIGSWSNADNRGRGIVLTVTHLYVAVWDVVVVHDLADMSVVASMAGAGSALNVGAWTRTGFIVWLDGVKNLNKYDTATNNFVAGYSQGSLFPSSNSNPRSCDASPGRIGQGV